MTYLAATTRVIWRPPDNHFAAARELFWWPSYNASGGRYISFWGLDPSPPTGIFKIYISENNILRFFALPRGMRGWTEGMPLPLPPLTSPPAPCLPPPSLERRAPRARIFFLFLPPSLPLFLSSPSSRPSSPSSRPFTSPLRPPHLPPPSYPVRPRRYFCMHTSKFSVSLHPPVIMKVHVQSLPLDDFADCLGNIKVVHCSYTFCICTEQPYPWHVFQYTPTFVKSVKIQMCVKIFWLEVTTCIKRTPMFNKLIFFISLKYNA